jgi:hypothetical protein
MDLVAFLLSNWETYVFVVPYLFFGFWIHRWLVRKAFRNAWMLLAAGLLYWLLFLAGLVVVAFAAEVFLMYRYAEYL